MFFLFLIPYQKTINTRVHNLKNIGKNTNPEIIKTFGYNSTRDINKFENIDTTNIDGINIINNTLGYMICQKIDSIDNDTHTLFIGKLIKGDLFEDKEAMSYTYYQEHKDEGKTAWICSVCGYIYYGDELPDDFECPICGVNKTFFDKK